MSQRRTLVALCGVALSAVLLLPDVSSAQLFGRGGRFFGGRMGNYGGWGNYGGYGGYYGGLPYYGNWGATLPGYTYTNPQPYNFSSPIIPGTYTNPQPYNFSSPIFQGTYYPGTYNAGVTASQSAYPPGAWMDSLKDRKRALIDMQVPPNAQVTFDGSPTQQQGPVRRFITPQLDDPSSDYTYNVSARWMQNGQEVRESRTIRLMAGQTTFVNFLEPQNNGNAPVSRQAAYPPDGRLQRPTDPTRALIDVHVPANAQVQFDGSPTVQQGPQRQFMTPPLDPNSRYTYKVTAKWTDQNGQEHRENRTVRLTPGQTAEVNFLTPQNNTQNPDGAPQPRPQQQNQKQPTTTPPDR